MPAEMTADANEEIRPTPRITRPTRVSRPARGLGPAMPRTAIPHPISPNDAARATPPMPVPPICTAPPTPKITIVTATSTQPPMRSTLPIRPKLMSGPLRSDVCHHEHETAGRDQQRPRRLRLEADQPDVAVRATCQRGVVVVVPLHAHPA